ncbi:dephospho-CoA kinase [Pelistega europaea]|uniref:Dephospho-CoA kinase n=1 Tax=Pelistega europaea TaxID=106147 RepID=A0A7Y4LBA5_9BURK|nr:dephospho-CoA kinase [Pelistega europaea]NOL50390.1 dephospho-CoA kinase [Pelistega europaea]
MDNRNRLFIGLTGGIGSGKSTVSAYLTQQGVTVIDADLISRSLTQADGLAIPAIKKAFGGQVIDAHNALDRAKMRQLVFSNPTAKKQLEQIIHPLVKEQMIKQAMEAESSPYIVFDVPLLIESIHHYRLWLSRICVVDCEPETQIVRVMQRSGLAEEMVRQIIAQQASRQQRLANADDIVHNGAGVLLEELHQQVDKLHAQWLILA